MPLDRFVNLAYTLIVEGADEDARAELDRALAFDMTGALMEDAAPAWWGGEFEAAVEAEQVAAWLNQPQAA